MRRVVAMLMVLGGLASADSSWADDRIDVGLLLGSTRTTDEGTVLQFGRGTTYEATFAWHAWTTEYLRLSIEVPLLATPAFEVTTPGPSLPLEYASLYLTPGVRVTVAPRPPVSIWGAVGGGFARYSERNLRKDMSPNPGQRDTNAGALQVGGGIDVRGFGWLGFRVEVRDVFTGARNFSIATPGPRVHNVNAAGGLVVRF